MPYSALPTVLGVGAAGALLYAVNAAFKDQTQYMIATLQNGADAFDRANEFDKATGERRAAVPPSAFQPPKPTFWEELQGRWNQRIVRTLQSVRESDPISALTKERVGSDNKGDGTRTAMLDALHSLAPHAKDAQPKIGILNRTYGDANTHYLGQGASLR